MERLTPAMRQYFEIKAEHEDAILFFRMGDFYEMFYEDAKLASGILGIALTSRDKQRRIPMCGVPYHSASSYISKLVREGHKVAICEQVEDASAAKGIVRRAVTRIITPGTAVEDELLESKSNNYIAAASVAQGASARASTCCGFAYMDVTTGEFRVTDLEGIDALMDELKRVQPSELVLPESLSRLPLLNGYLSNSNNSSIKNTTSLGDYDFLHGVALDRLLEHFGVTSLDGFGCGGMKEGIKAAGALLHYVREVQKAGLQHVKRCIPYYPKSFLVIDHSTRRNLEILENARTLERKGSLLDLLDRTRTSMGARMLRNWLTYPLVDVEQIRGRLDSVEELLCDRMKREEIKRVLAGIYDLERLTGKVSIGVAGPRDLVSLAESLESVAVLKACMEGFLSQRLSHIAHSLDAVPEVTDLIKRSISDSPPAVTRDGGFIRKGYSKELDELRAVSSGGKDWLARLEADERRRSGIQNLKVRYNKVFGYYIEVTKTNLANIPSDYIRKQTLVNAERFITPELKEWEARILNAEEKSRELELRLFGEITAEVSSYISRIQRTAELIATLDVLTSFADVSEEMNYTRPEINDGDAIVIEEGRHPVIEKNSTDGFVSNDLRLDTGNEQILILTGPNMAGKSTYIRQVALIVLMAQLGCFVPARRAVVGVVDRIFTRVGASDDISRGQSTFMVEMNETANILNNATSKSLIILDEIGRGTSTFDGLSIAWAVVEYIHDHPGLRAKTLFATHYHELTELSLTKERVKNYNMSVKEWEDRIIFLRKILPGGANRSYGIQVARLAGMPEPVIDRAREVLANLEKTELNEAGLPRIARCGNRAGDNGGQMNLPRLLGSVEGAQDDPVKDELTGLDLDRITPLEALNILNKLKGMLND